MPDPLAIPVVCTACSDTDLPWWQVAPLALVGCLLAVGLLWCLNKLLEATSSRRKAAPGPPPAPIAAPPGALDPGRRGCRAIAVNREHRFALEVDDRTGRFYVSIPVANRLAEYNEAYEIDRPTLDRFYADQNSALGFVARCRNREMDHLLREQPGADRGFPT
ncbi:MAG: hypothetical protein V7637_1270 [Mycobacteriales bacterium]